MLSANNLLRPQDGGPVTVPTQDMVLGSYYLTFERFENGVSQMTNDEYWPEGVDFALAGKTYDELTEEEKASVHMNIYRDEQTTGIHAGWDITGTDTGATAMTDVVNEETPVEEGLDVPDTTDTLPGNEEEAEGTDTPQDSGDTPQDNGDIPQDSGDIPQDNGQQ